MPIYEYSCEKCGHQTEIMHRISDPNVTECPSCHEQTLVKQVSAAGFRLKGGGWYETDFKASGKRNVAGESSTTGAESTGDKSEGSKSEAKSSHSCAAGACGCAPKTSSSTSSDSSSASPPAT
jgi:putative FmdB family regulatory protein